MKRQKLVRKKQQHVLATDVPFASMLSLCLQQSHADPPVRQQQTATASHERQASQQVFWVTGFVLVFVRLRLEGLREGEQALGPSCPLATTSAAATITTTLALAVLPPLPMRSSSWSLCFSLPQTCTGQMQILLAAPLPSLSRGLASRASKA